MCIVDKDNIILLDTFCKPEEPVVDYRTERSGIFEEDLENAPDFEIVRDAVIRIFKFGINILNYYTMIFLCIHLHM